MYFKVKISPLNWSSRSTSKVYICTVVTVNIMLFNALFKCCTDTLKENMVLE